MKTRKEWIEQRARALNQMEDMQKRASSEGRAMNDDENKQWDQHDRDFEEANTELGKFDLIDKRREAMDREERGGDQPRNQADKGPKVPTYEEAFRKWAVRGGQSLTGEEQTVLMRGEQRGTNTLLAGDVSTTYAGYMVPEGFSNEISHTLKAFGGMLQACRIFATATGNNIQWPTLDDTSNTGELTAEGAAVTTLDATFSRKTLAAYNITSKLTRVSLQLIQDEGVMFDTELPKILGVRLGRALNTYLTTGSGTSQPAGVMTATVGSAAGVTAGATSITRANLIDLVGSIDPEYLNVPGKKAWMFNNATLTYLKKLSIGSNDDRPLLYMGMNETQPATLEGYEYIINQDIASIATTAKSVAFGNWDYYIIRQVQPGNSLVRLNERYMDELEVGFLIWGRYDGRLLQTGAIKHLVHS